MVLMIYLPSQRQDCILRFFHDLLNHQVPAITKTDQGNFGPVFITDTANSKFPTKKVQTG